MKYLALRTTSKKNFRKGTRVSWQFYSVISIAVMMLLSTACAPRMMVKPEAFGTKKKLAIVSIAGPTHFNAGSKTTKEFFTGYDESNNTQPILDKMKVGVWKALKQSKHFKLANPKQVRNSKVYKEIEADKPVFRVGIFSTDMNTAKDYKYFSEKEKFSKLANGLGVDGVIQITIFLSTRDTKIYAVGLGAKKTRVHAVVSLVAYNRNGNVIWQDSIEHISEDGLSKAMILVDTGNINYAKLIPLAEKVAQEGITKIVENLNNKMRSGNSLQQQAKK